MRDMILCHGDTTSKHLSHLCPCSFKSERNVEERRSRRCCHYTTSPSPLLEIDVRGRESGAAGSHCGEMKHAAGPEAADELSFFISQRDITHRAGSCCFFSRRLLGSQLSERESPHWIWTYALDLLCVCFFFFLLLLLLAPWMKIFAHLMFE